MSNRTSLFPPTTSQNATSSSAIKARQIAHLAQQLAVLSKRTEELDRLTITTAEQASYMRLLGGYGGSWFMSAGCVMTPSTAEQTGQPPQQQQQDDDAAKVEREET